ncbi:MAG: polyribonucleotide nucleotidyltransferase [Dehalococcoidia bacterium]|nr:polyribonucleotide nucleotidyltransferase [Dehalococcoidia bacterium]
MAHSVIKEIAGRKLSIETGRLANQAGGSVLLTYGETTILVAATAAGTPREGVDFLPLTVDYEERSYAAGKIPGSFFRREGRPSQEATLTARLTDRCLRPLFPKNFHNEIQVIVTVLSADQENDPDLLSIIGSSCALGLSNIPFDGPVSATRIGYIGDSIVVNPTFEDLKESKLDLVVAGTEESVVMVESGSDEISEEIILDAVRVGQENNREIISLQKEIIQIAAKEKMDIAGQGAINTDLMDSMKAYLGGRISDTVFTGTEKGERDGDLDNLKDEVRVNFAEEYDSEEISSIFESLVKKEVRSRILDKGERTDGRGLTEIRSITCDTSLIPRVHGSGLFNRGQTQIMTVLTLGSMADQQKLDTISPAESKRFMHHYNFPPYSVGEVRRVGNPGRREIGHGALAERAIAPVIPDAEEFPYTIRLVSEAFGSNGSTSMGSVCGSTLALMDAGVPIKAPVAGVAMGLVMDEDGKYAILTDIQGVEDFLGDMDFKVAGTANGVNALQMDIKIKGITPKVMEEALNQAKQARFVVLEKIQNTLDGPRADLSPHAPRMIRLTIPVDKIGTVIGPGGKTIRSIIEDTKASIDVENDGTVIVGSTDADAANKAIARIEDLTREVEIGGIYTGKVTRIMTFGAFVEVLPGKDALVHISELSEERVQSVEDVLEVGEEVTVLVTEKDPMGRLNASRKALLRTDGEAGSNESPSPPSGDSGNRSRFDRRSGGSSGSNRRGRFPGRGRG